MKKHGVKQVLTGFCSLLLELHSSHSAELPWAQDQRHRVSLDPQAKIKQVSFAAHLRG